MPGSMGGRPRAFVLEPGMAIVINIELARQARIARETRCHFIGLKPMAKRKAKAISKRDAVRQHGKAWL